MEERRWIHTRELLAMMVNTTPREKAEMVTGADMIPLSFDAEQQPRNRATMDKTPEELERIRKLYNS